MIEYSRFLPWVLSGFGFFLFFPFSHLLSFICLILFIIGWRDYRQEHHAVLRNYPVTGHLRFMLEYIRPRFGSIFSKAMKKIYPSREISVPWCIRVQNDKMMREDLAPSNRCMAKIQSG
jgi:hypothetical protein